jgi:hypothetical protein
MKDTDDHDCRQAEMGDPFRLLLGLGGLRAGLADGAARSNQAALRRTLRNQHWG